VQLVGCPSSPILLSPALFSVLPGTIYARVRLEIIPPSSYGGKASTQWNGLHPGNATASVWERKKLVHQMWPALPSELLVFCEIGVTYHSQQTMVSPNASLETHLESCVLWEQPCRPADSAPGSWWTAERSHTPTPRLWTESRHESVAWFLRGIPVACIPSPFLFSIPFFLGHSHLARQLTISPSTVWTKLTLPIIPEKIGLSFSAPER
jgi:hypothetical protein